MGSEQDAYQMMYSAIAIAFAASVLSCCCLASEATMTTIGVKCCCSAATMKVLVDYSARFCGCSSQHEAACTAMAGACALADDCDD